MANVAIITARGGSKRIPRKNIKLFRGKPIIAYSIETAINSGLFDYVMVSTDDDEIAEIAIKYGAEIPFKRSKQNSDDYTGTADVMLEVLTELNKTGKKFTNACCMYPTAPFISVESLKEAYSLLIERKYNSVFPICPFSFPIQRALEINNSLMKMVHPENLNTRSQDLVPRYHDAGQFYWINIEQFFKEKKILTNNTGSIILSELQVQDIDNEIDWKLAELKHQLLFPNND
jgi:pseudaminic acid cytidylyltransferase